MSKIDGYQLRSSGSCTEFILPNFDAVEHVLFSVLSPS